MLDMTDFHDATTHRRSWLDIFDSYLGTLQNPEDISYVSHERKALERLLNSISEKYPYE